ncbi:transposable element Tc1 transposase [Elysia marginata]|uniref:Transposable element Tc1 transposase n=1 Tax=Elysia marginata TaxID=1093978 RepID=A0AAV4IJL6_9GAST|nr:transposable element Tc1 transposase [Elysia marginata]
MPRLRENERNQLIGMIRGGVSVSTVAHHFNVTRRTVYVTLQRERATGSQKDRPRRLVNGQARAFGGGSVMVWGGITAAGKTPLVPVHGNLTARRYIDEILRPHVVPAIHNQGLTFMQDNAQHIELE